jgi:hypothetical protein
VRPGGVAALLWNVRNSRVPWMGELQSIIGGEDSMQLVAGESTQDVLTRERAATADIAQFLPGVERATFEHVVPMSPEAVVGLVGTFSYVRLSPRADELYAEVRDLLATHPDTRGHDVVDVAYVTATYRVRLD